MAEHFRRAGRRVSEFVRWFYRYRSIRLTSEGTRFILLTLAVGVAALNTGNNLLYLLLAMLLSLIIMSGILSEQCLKKLTIRRRPPAHIFAGRPTTCALSIANRKPRLPTFSLRVMDVVAGKAVDRGIHLLHLPPTASVTQAYPVLFTRRGRHRIEGIKLLTRFPFGLFIKAATLPLESDLVVYPACEPLPADLLHDLAALGQDHAVLHRGHGVELYNLREYLSSDDSRAIHWKTSARQARLMVRESEAEDQRQVTLALSVGTGGGRSSAGPPPAEIVEPADQQNAFERAVVLTASLASYFHERAFSVRLLVGDQEIPHGVGEAHRYRILRALALCDPSSAMGPARVPEGFLRLGGLTAQGELTVLVLPWPDPRLTATCAGVSRVVKAWESP